MRRVALRLTFVAAVGLAVWACTSSYGSTPDGLDDPGTDAGPLLDQGAPDVVTSTPNDGVDSGSEAGTDAAPPCVVECDCDGDGYLPDTAACRVDGGKASDAGDAGNVGKVIVYDCDDHDPGTHPGAPLQSRVPVPPQTGDWDCSGTVDVAYTSDLTCTFGIAGCSGMGFVGNVGCGVKADFVSCTSSAGLACAPTVVDSRVQLCK
jgi:hypothetical protein